MKMTAQSGSPHSLGPIWDHIAASCVKARGGDVFKYNNDDNNVYF
jgi:hypothetical protein